MTVIESPQSKATTSNPKDLFGAMKVSLSKLPAVAVAHGAHAMMDGARKYGAYNWRDKKVIASIYVDAARRHIDNWFEGQRTASDSGVHHLGHAIACAAILLDAEATGNLVDDRPVGSEIADKVYNEIAATIAARAKSIDPHALVTATEARLAHNADPTTRHGGLPRMQEQAPYPPSKFGFTLGETVNLLRAIRNPGKVTGFTSTHVCVLWKSNADGVPSHWRAEELRHGE